jgi:hypothetical protein
MLRINSATKNLLVLCFEVGKSDPSLAFRMTIHRRIKLGFISCRRAEDHESLRGVD